MAGWGEDLDLDPPDLDPPDLDREEVRVDRGEDLDPEEFRVDPSTGVSPGILVSLGLGLGRKGLSLGCRRRSLLYWATTPPVNWREISLTQMTTQIPNLPTSWARPKIIKTQRTLRSGLVSQNGRERGEVEKEPRGRTKGLALRLGPVPLWQSGAVRIGRRSLLSPSLLSPSLPSPSLPSPSLLRLSLSLEALPEAILPQCQLSTRSATVSASLFGTRWVASGGGATRKSLRIRALRELRLRGGSAGGPPSPPAASSAGLRSMFRPGWTAFPANSRPTLL